MVEAVALDLFACLYDGLRGDLAIGSRILEYHILGLQRTIKQLRATSQGPSARAFAAGVRDDLVCKSDVADPAEKTNYEWWATDLFPFDRTFIGAQNPVWSEYAMQTLPTIGLCWVRWIDKHIADAVTGAFGFDLGSEIG